MADDFDDVEEFDIERDLARAEMTLTVRVERRRYDKPVTVVEGFEGDAVDLDELASTLKVALGAGGTVNGNRIEIQGDHADRVPDRLREEGFTVD